MGVINVTSSGLGPAVTNTGGHYITAPVQQHTSSTSGVYGPVTMGLGNHQEFGKVFDMSQMMSGTPDFEMSDMNMIIRDYQATKSKSFPGWKGFPEIKVNQTIQGGMQVAWYARVPNEEVYNYPEESQLWDE